VVDAQAVQNRGVEVVDVCGVLDDVVTEVVGLAVHDPFLDAPAGEPDGEALGMVVAAVVVAGQCPLTDVYDAERIRWFVLGPSDSLLSRLVDEWTERGRAREEARFGSLLIIRLLPRQVP